MQNQEVLKIISERIEVSESRPSYSQVLDELESTAILIKIYAAS